jgi:hypothetical protein
MADLQTIPTGDIVISPDMNSWSSVPVGYQLLIARVNTSTTSVAIGTGARTFTLAQSGNQEWAASGSVTVTSSASSANTMTGTVTSYNSSTQALVINVTSVTGSGTFASWIIEDLTSPFVLLIEDDGDRLLIE